MKKITSTELVTNYIVGLEDAVLAKRLEKLFDEQTLLKLANPIPVAIRPKPNFSEVFRKFFTGSQTTLVEVTSVQLQKDKLLVRYIATRKRWFPTQETADKAVEKHDVYAGSHKADETNTISAEIEFGDSQRVDIEDFAEGLEVEYL